MLKVGPSDKCLEAFARLQRTKKGKKAKEDPKDKPKYQLYKIATDSIEMELESTGKDEAGKDLDDKALHAAFVADLKKTGEPRFGCLDLLGKVFFVSYSPDTSK